MKRLFSVFLDGVLWFFSFGENPVRRLEKTRRESTDSGSMARDWDNAGNDIRAAMSSFKARKTV